MALTINQKIELLELQIAQLIAKVADMDKTVVDKPLQPYSKVGRLKDDAQNVVSEIETGFGGSYASKIIWNEKELTFPAFGSKPSAPEKGYNRHSHSRFSGGALDINTLELVDYDINWETNLTHNKDCQSLWLGFPPTKIVQNSKNENVNKIGKIDFIFDADAGYDANNRPIGKWGIATYEIDIDKCYFVRRHKTGEFEGEIMLDENGNEMKAKLFDEDDVKTNLVWDKNAQKWRFYAVYAEDPEEE